MRKILIFYVLFITCFSNLSLFAQANSAYEVEVLVSKNKDTKEVDSVIDFQKDKFTINSDKKGKYNREFEYKNVKRVQYSYTKTPFLDADTPNWAKSLVGLFILPTVFQKPRTHWLTIVTDKDFVVIKLERDNHRQIRLEFEVHDVKVKTVAEDSSINEN